MSDVAIRVEGLGKQYRIGRRERYRTLRDTITETITARLRRGGSLLRKGAWPEEPSDLIWALRDVSFEVPAGSVVGVIGRNGAGKSTLLKILSRITEQTEGRIEIHGRVGSLLEVGTGFHPELSGRENIFLNGAILGMRRAEIARKFEEIVSFAEVEKFIDTPVKHYSTGMYMRLAFAVAAHLDPETLVIDEVLAVGDAQFQRKCLGKMGQVAATGRTILFVSHNLSAIQALCRTSIMLQAGRLVAHGPTDQVVSHYMCDAVASASGDFVLDSHIARTTINGPLIRRVILRDDRGVKTFVLRSGSGLNIEIYVKSQTALTEPRVAIAIEDQVGRRIGTTASYMGPFQVPERISEFVVHCRIPSIPLGAGRYLLSFSVSEKLTGLVDSIDSAAWFDVHWDNSYGNGEAYHPVFGPVLIEADWTFDGDEAVQPIRLRQPAAIR